MQIKEIMATKSSCCTPETSCVEAAAAMRDDDVGALPVCNGEGKCIGIVTDRDILSKVCANKKDVASTQVSECMSSSIQTCYEDEELAEAERIISQNQVRRVPVLDRNEQLVGIVSLADIARRVSEQEGGRVLNAISQQS